MRNRGSILLAILVMVMLAACAMGLLTQTYWHLHIVRARRQHLESSQAVRNELVRVLHRWHGQVTALEWPDVVEPEKEVFAGERFPPQEAGQTTVSFSFRLGPVWGATDGVFRSVIAALRATDGRSAWRAEAQVVVARGFLPVTAWPVLLHGQETVDPLSSPPPVRLPAGTKVQRSTRGLTEDTAAVLPGFPDFTGDSGEWPVWRRKLGQPASSQPLADGVYLAREKGRVDAVFVQGAVDELVFACAGEWQEFRVWQGGRCWSFAYVPGKAQWRGPDGVEAVGFAEQLYINGRIDSLTQAGGSAFQPRARLRLYCSAAVTIRSSLTVSGLTLSTFAVAGLTLTAKTVRVSAAGATVAATVIASGALSWDDAFTLRGTVCARGIGGRGELTLRPPAPGSPPPTAMRLDERHCRLWRLSVLALQEEQ